MLNIAVKAARRAGQIINRASLDIGGVKVTTKQQNDFVTEVDKAAEAAIIGILLDAYPKHAILAEETGDSGASGSEYQWIIDPLDGTVNFAHGLPFYASSVACVECRPEELSARWDTATVAAAVSIPSQGYRAISDSLSAALSG